MSLEIIFIKLLGKDGPKDVRLHIKHILSTANWIVHTATDKEALFGIHVCTFSNDSGKLALCIISVSKPTKCTFGTVSADDNLSKRGK